MLELLSTYSLTQIVTFIVLLAIAVKEGITLVIWFKDLFKKKFNDDMKNTVATKKHNEQICKINCSSIILFTTLTTFNSKSRKNF